MSKCMTIDETIDQKDTCPEITPKDIVDFILEEALLSAFIVLDKGCSRIGDFNVTEDFRQQYDQLPHLKDFEQVDHTENQESNLDSGETVDRTARENLEQIIDSFVKKEEKLKPGGECTVLGEDVLANNELQIQNGQIHLGKNDKPLEEEDFFLKEDEVADEKIEIEFLNEGKLNKINVPLKPSGSHVGNRTPEEVKDNEEKEVEYTQNEPNIEEDSERPFKPLTTEELRQVWGSESCSLVGKWDGDAFVQREEAVRLMEELSFVHVFPNSAADPNRPRACSFAEEDVKKMIKEIEEISFTQCVTNSEDPDVGYHPDGQGDADLDLKSPSKSKDNIAKSQKIQKIQEESLAEGLIECKYKNSKEPLGEQHPDEISTEGEATGQSKVFFSNMLYAVTPEPTSKTAESNELDLEPSNGQQNLLEDSEGMATSSEEVRGFNYDMELSPETIQTDFSCISFLKTGKDITQNESELFLTEAINPKDFQTNQNACEEFFPDTMSLSGNIGSLSRCKLDDLAFKNLEFPSELDIGAFEEKHSDATKESRRGIDGPGSSSQIQQGTSSLGRLNASSSETYKRLNVDSFSEENDLQFLSVDTNLYVTKTGEIRASQDPGNFFQGSSSLCEIPRNDRDSGFITGELDPNLEEALNVREKSGESFSNFQEKVASDSGKFEEEGTHPETDDMDVILAQTAIVESDKSLKKKESKNEEASSRTPSGTNDSNDSINVPAESSGGLHSQKMYWGTKYELRGQSPDECTLTESEEAFIDMTESVIQIIEPPENSWEEDSTKILLSLLSETPDQKLHPRNKKPEELSSDKSNSELENPTKRTYSGMTTIGPIKSADHDPKDLTAPEVDFGKMTRITSSRQLAKDLGLFSAEVTTIKIVEEDDSDGEVSMGGEEDRLEHTSLINRDIASLTKVQKIREVMSYHPKPEEDFEDDDVFTRPRLDLKNVESMTDERYKVPDISVPLLSLELGEGNLEAEKELIDSIGLVISGLTEPAFYGEHNEAEEEVENVQGNVPKVEAVEKRSSSTVDKSKENSEMSLEEENKPEAEVEPKESLKTAENVLPHDSLHKYGTLGGVFKKASSKLLRKEGDLSVRNTKSLPRDSCRMNATESIRSIIDDCHSSASNMLKKSRSLLKNTQSMFKSISQSRMTSEPVSGPSPDSKKLSPSESDVSTIEMKFSGFLKKEDFAKAKNLIKDKVEKTLKSFDGKKSSTNELETPTEKKELRIAVRNKDNLQVDRMENFKKFLPKSPLVYKSQFVKSQMDVQSRAEESASATSSSVVPEQHENVARSVSAIVFKDSYENIPAEPTEFQSNDTPYQEKLQWINVRENVEFSKNKELEPQQPEYIIMETVEGLPATDLESPSSEKENLSTGKTKKTGIKKEGKKVGASDSSKIISDVVAEFPEADDDKMEMKTSSENKIKTKKKKFTARFWSFWCSAFGKVKTPPAKGDLP